MKKFFKGLGIFITLVAVGIVSAFAVVALLLRQEEVKVPDLTGQEIVNVIEIVTQQGLQLKVERREPHPTLLRDAIISQSPVAGSGLKKGRQVRVVVSLGPLDTLAPKLTGEHFRKADMLVRQAGFMPGIIARVYSDSVERDMVIGQAPEPGSPLERNGKINMLVSSGKKAPSYAMPKLTGAKAEEAIKIVERMGLQHRVVSKAAGDKPATQSRMVVFQKPAAGSPVAGDAVVDIVVSK